MMSSFNALPARASPESGKERDMVRNRMERLGFLPAAVTVIALLFSACAGVRTQMGGSIQGASLSLSGVTSTIAGASLIGSQDGKRAVARFYSPCGVTTDGTNL